jgi:hypothetical protein
VALEKGFLPVLRFPPVSVIPPMPYTLSFANRNERPDTWTSHPLPKAQGCSVVIGCSIDLVVRLLLVVWLLFVLFCVLFVCKCVLPPGDNPIAVNKFIIIIIGPENSRSLRLPELNTIST